MAGSIAATQQEVGRNGAGDAQGTGRQARSGRRLFLLCFDQADNLDEEQVRALTRFLHDVLDSAGNLLVVTLPATTAFKTEEFRALENWVRSGNTLLVLAALSDNPDWAFALGGLASGDLSRS